jgi:monoamine oxidase
VDAPETAARAAEWDAITLGAWLARRARTRRAREALAMFAELEVAAAADDVSLLVFLWALRMTGGLDRTGAFAGDAVERRFVGGAQQLSVVMARELGDRVRLRSPIVALERTGGGVLARTAAGDRVAAGRAIVALAPALVARLDMPPALPPRRAQLGGAMPVARVIKLVATYERPFWRARGLSGEAYVPRGPVRAVVDACSHDGAQAALVALSSGVDAGALAALPAKERRAVMIAELARLFGPDAATPTHARDVDWGAEPYSGGCVSVMGPGALSRCAPALRAPVGRVHFAGTEAARTWAGTLEGAVESGDRAVAEVLSS